MKTLLISLLLLLTASQTFGQLDPLRYHQKRFPSSTITSNVTYGSAPQWIFPYWNETLKLDVFRPTNDTLTRRPLLIFAHSGGFLNGSRTVDDMVAICDSFAQKGYVTATIDYRKGFNPLDGESCERAVYRGIQDGKAAVRYFKHNASTYGIDTNFIYFGGMSAGGFIALHVAYMDLESERPASTFGGGTVNNLGCLDCSGNTHPVSSKVRGVLDYWGAMQDTSMITGGNVPCLVMHGQNDGTVPHDSGHPFGVSTIPVTMGGGPIFARLQNTGVYSEYYTSEGPHHMLDGSDNGTFPASGPNSFWSDTLLPRTTDFLIKTMKPAAVKLSADTLYACAGMEKEFFVQLEQPNHRVIWQYPATGLSYTQTTVPGRLAISYSIPGEYPITALVFNEVLCASDTMKYLLIVEDLVAASITATYLGGHYYQLTTTANTPVTWIAHGINLGLVDTLLYMAEIQDNSIITAIITSPNGACSQSIQFQLDHDALSIATTEMINTQAFPNPFNKQITVSHLGEATIQVYDVTGRHVYSTSFENTHEINTLAWPIGYYVLEIKSSEGSWVTRMVK